MAKKGLGKGLNSLFNEEDIEEVTSEITKSSEGDIKKVRMSLIEPNKKQPRRHFDEEKITALADSIKEHGLIQPIIITPSDNNMYKIVAGERRWRAAKKANLKEIPAVIRKYSEEQVAEIALIENLQRENLNPIEEAIGYNLLMDEFNLTQELISQRVGKSRSAITITITNFVLTLILFIPIPPTTSFLFYEPNFKSYLYFSTLCLFYHSIFDIFRDFILFFVTVHSYFVPVTIR